MSNRRDCQNHSPNLRIQASNGVDESTGSMAVVKRTLKFSLDNFPDLSDT